MLLYMIEQTLFIGSLMSGKTFYHHREQCLATLIIFIQITLTQTQPIKQGDFWEESKTTLLLSEIRNNNTAQSNTLQIEKKRDPILDNPDFLPLCGNGRIDTQADYQAYYQTHRPLTLTKAQLIPLLTSVT